MFKLIDEIFEMNLVFMHNSLIIKYLYRTDKTHANKYIFN